MGQSVSEFKRRIKDDQDKISLQDDLVFDPVAFRTYVL